MDDMMNRLQEILNDEESMEQIKKIAGMIGGENGGEMPDLSSILNSGNSNNGNNDNTNPENTNFDFSKLIIIQQILSEANKKDPNTEFLYALKPLLKNESQEKIDKISKVLKIIALWPVIKESGILGGDFFDFL